MRLSVHTKVKLGDAVFGRLSFPPRFKTNIFIAIVSKQYHLLANGEYELRYLYKIGRYTKTNNLEVFPCWLQEHEVLITGFGHKDLKEFL